MSRFLLIGPPKIGKSVAANRIANALGCKNIKYEWHSISQLPDGVLAITNDPEAACNVMHYQDIVTFRVESSAGLQALVDALERKQVTSERSDTARVLTCVYCGHEYHQDTPASGSKVLTDHIKVCEQHPMRKIEADNVKLRKALAGLVGADSKDLLDSMEATICTLPQIPEEDRINTINAICALRDTIAPVPQPYVAHHQV